MSAENRNFNNYIMGDNVYELGQGVVLQTAELVGIPMGDEPNSAALDNLVQQLGPNRELRTNPDIPEIERGEAVGLVLASGVQQALDRSLWTPDITFPVRHPAVAVISGGVANWQDRTANILLGMGPQRSVYAAVGNRVMELPTEKTNPNVLNFYYEKGRFPTETEYMQRIIAPKLEDFGHDVEVLDFKTKKGNEIALGLFQECPELLSSNICFYRVANAGIQLAVEMRTAAKLMKPEFDTNGHNPQVYVRTDAFPLAMDEEQDNDAVHFQKAKPALRQMAVTARKLHEVAGGE